MNTIVFDSIPNNGHSATQTGTASAPLKAPDPQVIQKPTRRRFSVADKLRILKLADACHKQGELGALLRREGLYSSTLANFRKQREMGRLQEISHEQKVTQRRTKEAARQQENRKIARMQHEILQLRALLNLQKKLSDLLGIHLQSLPSSEVCE